ncbi:sulfotransferase domain-containing protein [Mucisphaera sp.]|uniref:sulfotransferase domain-containing protein n=1 Tax=Mucisphaera sp. TaxID=2913024 RepID=UPI003D09BA69
MRRHVSQALRNAWYLGLNQPRLTVRPTDGFLVSWPRSGNTWMRYMLAEVLVPNNDLDMTQIEDLIPIVDRPDFTAALRQLDNRQPPRLFKSHELVDTRCLTGRVIYIVRDPRDAIPSFYKYRTQRSRWKMTWDRFFTQSIANKHRYGSWHRHVAGWLKHSDHPNFLLVRYEDMLADAARELARVVQHLGLTADQRLIQQAVERSSVDRVSHGFAKVASTRGLAFQGGSGGGTGKARDNFSPQQTQQLINQNRDILRQLDYPLDD